MTNAEILDLKKMDIRYLEKMKKLVKEFYMAFGQEKYLNKGMYRAANIERIKLRNKLFDEELKEFLEAETDVEKLDAICDMYYIAIGTTLELGAYGNQFYVIDYYKKRTWFNDELIMEAFEEVHKSNMSKLENRKAIFREDGKILKGKNYFRPNLENFF
nr:nucleoside triphosphate pyrophosphohydrolase family protein [uncultured Leptotrichia sp.]